MLVGDVLLGRYCSPTDPIGDVAGVARPGVATAAALVVAALQTLAARLLAGRAVPHTALEEGGVM